MLRYIFESNTKAEASETRSLYEQLREAQKLFGPPNQTRIDDVEAALSPLTEEWEALGSSPILKNIEELLYKIASSSDLYSVLELASPELARDMEADSEIRQRMQRKLSLYAYATENRTRIQKILVEVGRAILGALPASAFQSKEQYDLEFSIPLIDTIESAAGLTNQLSELFATQDLNNTTLFHPLRESLDQNIEHVSSTIKKDARPTDLVDKLSPREITNTYLAYTELAAIFNWTVSFSIPLKVRFEHTYLCAGSGHGKTQTLQHMILKDLERALDGKGGFAVIDSQGDLIENILRLKDITKIQDKLLLIDANDIAYPLALNMFDIGRDRMETLEPVDREKILNGTIDLYEYIFSSLLGAELTQKQGVLFAYLARLMLAIPGATITTLGDFVTGDKALLEQAIDLDPGTTHFFKTQFFSSTFTQTRKQVYTRLLGVLSNPTMERMFSAEKNKIDMFSAINSGKIVLINTAKDLLKGDRSSIFGRFMIAMISQAAMSRTIIPAKKRTPFMVYIDEAHEYFDEKMDDIANQARKMNVAMVLAHQNLSQTPSGLKATLMASTSTKMVGGVSATDAQEFAKNMRCKADDILAVRKTNLETKFLCYVRNVTPTPIEISIPLGQLEKRPKLTEEEYQEIIAQNRERVAVPLTSFTQPEPPDPPDTVVSDSEAPVVDTPKEPVETDKPTSGGKGGKQHTSLQSELKHYAESIGLGVTIEKHIGKGSHIDLVLFRGNWQVACEISVSTSAKHECKNIEKCISAGYEKVFLIVNDQTTLETKKKYVSKHLPKNLLPLVEFHTFDSAKAALQSSQPPPTAKVVHGYELTTTFAEISPEEKERREAVFTKVVRGEV